MVLVLVMGRDFGVLLLLLLLLLLVVVVMVVVVVVVFVVFVVAAVVKESVRTRKQDRRVGRRCQRVLDATRARPPPVPFHVAKYVAKKWQLIILIVILVMF